MGIADNLERSINICVSIAAYITLVQIKWQVLSKTYYLNVKSIQTRTSIVGSSIVIGSVNLSKMFSIDLIFRLQNIINK